RFTQLGKFITTWRQSTASPYSWIDVLMFDAYFPTAELQNDNPFVKEILRTGREVNFVHQHPHKQQQSKKMLS
ncbi:MAG: hypothetical protein FWF77_00095, partial [Defluviitaleaceae bacterium]|nr:hypothetical protein [Defluviitaleaceae bacterium]